MPMSGICVDLEKQIVLRTKRLLRVRNVRGAAHDPEQGSIPAAAARPASPPGGLIRRGERLQQRPA